MEQLLHWFFLLFGVYPHFISIKTVFLYRSVVSLQLNNKVSFFIEFNRDFGISPDFISIFRHDKSMPAGFISDIFFSVGRLHFFTVTWQKYHVTLYQGDARMKLLTCSLYVNSPEMFRADVPIPPSFNLLCNGILIVSRLEIYTEQPVIKAKFILFQQIHFINCRQGV